MAISPVQVLLAAAGYGVIRVVHHVSKIQGLRLLSCLPVPGDGCASQVGLQLPVFSV